MPCSFAASFTGGGSRRRPLPRGLSGCVTTAGISWPASMRAFKEGTANSGVPMNTILQEGAMAEKFGEKFLKKVFPIPLSKTFGYALRNALLQEIAKSFRGSPRGLFTKNSPQEPLRVSF